MSQDILNKKNRTESDEITMRRIIGEVIDHRKLIITLTAFITILTVIYALFATPVFQADSLVQVEQKAGNAILESLNQVLPDAVPQSAPEITLLQSRMILGKTVSDLNLQTVVKQEYFPIFGRGWARLTGQKSGHLEISRLYLPRDGDKDPKVTLTVIDANNYVITGKDFEIKGEVGKLLDGHGISIKVNSIVGKVNDEFELKSVTNLEAINNLQDNYTVSEQGKDSGMLALTVTGTNPVLIKDILNSITQNYLSQNIDRQAAQDEKSLDFLKLQLPKVRSELDLAEDKLNNYRQEKNTIDLPMEAKAVLEQIVNVDNQLNELTFREAEISQLYTKDHPIYKSLLEKRQTLKQEKDRLSENVSSMPTTQQEVLRLSRDVESGRAVYMQLLNRQQELNIAKSSAIGNVRIIDDAVTEPKPVKPRKILVIVMGLILGGFLSLSVVFGIFMLRRGLYSPEQLEELGITVYASVPVSEWSLKRSNIKDNNRTANVPGLLACENPADLAIEAIRSLRTSLHFAMLDAKNNLLMISGASPEAGKTFISSNLAEVISKIGKKVIFIDADMRRGDSHRALGVDNDIGLSEILSGSSSIIGAVKKISGISFDYVSRGKVPPNPAELLTNSRFENLLTWASENYDLVIIDTPPILAVTEAAIIGRYVGTTLLVVGFESNTAKEVEVSINRLALSGIIVKGCILNRVVKKSANYHEYGYHNYGYKYSSDNNN
ncbi:polysaccharide biosynthesis tyrosine autokinase [Rahnella sp. FC061912-K]|uniref:polysaccharide biosynthesis tyrosine autokinase n=1 Tax=Rahnella rivi TaxID=2816249 RepID=UPI001C255DED|nr:polysaccharide biosynthesis tyrosine autokinase [Rahnella rivi]MBU9828912.1 polysaccharide biosynthesis tyrosine autokinase [Rahnella rivi]